MSSSATADRCQRRPISSRLGVFARKLQEQAANELSFPKGENELSPESIRKLFPIRSLSKTNLHSEATLSKNNSPPTCEDDDLFKATRSFTDLQAAVPIPTTQIIISNIPISNTAYATTPTHDFDQRGKSVSLDCIPITTAATEFVSSYCKDASSEFKPFVESHRTKSELLSAQKSLSNNDSGIASSVSALSLATEALDLSVGLTNKQACLKPIMEDSESPGSLLKFGLPDVKHTPIGLGHTKMTKSEGCINIPREAKSQKPSPPMVLDAAPSLEPPKLAVYIPSNPTPRSGRVRKKYSADTNDAKSRQKKHETKFASLRGTPKGFAAAAAKEALYAEYESHKWNKWKPDWGARCHVDWNTELERVQGKKYAVIKPLGKGASGEVSLVAEEESQTLYAMKCVNLNGISDTIVQQCINEIEMLIDLKDTNLVVKIMAWEINKVRRTMKIIMEYGQSDLGAYLKRNKCTVQKVQFFWRSMLTIVAKIHERGIVHSDLKPANFVLVCSDLKLIDFGIASRMNSELTSIATLNPKGTLNYISPETVRPDKSGNVKIGPKSDIWALGCILYLMVYGKTPFEEIPYTASKTIAIGDGNVIYPPLPAEFQGTGVDKVLRSCFVIDHRQRPTALQLLTHPFACSINYSN